MWTLDLEQNLLEAQLGKCIKQRVWIVQLDVQRWSCFSFYKIFTFHKISSLVEFHAYFISLKINHINLTRLESKESPFPWKKELTKWCDLCIKNEVTKWALSNSEFKYFNCWFLNADLSLKRNFNLFHIKLGQIMKVL